MNKIFFKKWKLENTLKKKKQRQAKETNCEEVEIWVVLQSTKEIEWAIENFLPKNAMILLDTGTTVLGCEIYEGKE